MDYSKGDGAYLHDSFAIVMYNFSSNRGSESFGKKALRRWAFLSLIFRPGSTSKVEDCELKANMLFKAAKITVYL